MLNYPLAKGLGLNDSALQSDEGVRVFAGNHLPTGAQPLAQAYAGHQFGGFTMLGDGRAVLLGEHITPQGERFDIQLKGSGQTPYSRQGDGRAALGPMLREYIISEALFALGIPTTRSLAVVTTGETIRRETNLPGAILTRVAASHVRVGTFEYIAEWGTVEELRILADYILDRHFPNAERGENRYLSLLREVIDRQALLIARWQLVGFIHGVMNTDNMALSGETIDFGPCAFMDAYDPATVFSSIDIHGRYSYSNQPIIAQWNLARFAETLLPLLHSKETQAIALANEAIEYFTTAYRRAWLMGMRAKLGLCGEEEQDEVLINDLLLLMQHQHADYTNTFRALTYNTRRNSSLFESTDFAGWNRSWQERRAMHLESDSVSQKLMHAGNPAVIPRNHRVEEALEAAHGGDYLVIERLLKVLSNPYDYATEPDEYYTQPAPATVPYRTFCGT